MSQIYEEILRVKEVSYTTASTGVISVDVATPDAGVASMFMLNGAVCTLTEDGEILTTANESTGAYLSPVVQGIMKTNGSNGVADTVTGVDASSSVLIIGTSSTPVGALTITPTTNTLTLASSSASDTAVYVKYLLRK